MPPHRMLERCSQCGADLTADGLCPACMLEGGLTPEFGDGVWMVETRAAEPLPPLFGDYQFLEEIARGGMGVVYKARQVSLNRIVAVKMVLAGRLAKQSDLQRFRAEAEAAAQLQHPNIIAIHEVGEHEGQPFFSMDYVEGQSLAELAHNQPLPARPAAAYLKTIAEAVEHAHSKGVLHRDLKPSNILIDHNDQPRITDFGLAKRLTDFQLSAPDPQLTLTGQVLGSPNFMPPEQATGDKRSVGPASDVYSLGAILYQLLTGRPPFLAETLTQTLRLVAETEPISPRLLNPSVPRDLETACVKCLEKEPAKRYASAQELADELGRFLSDEPIQARPVTQAEKVWRWCRRNRALASSAGAAVVLLLAIAVGSPIALFRIHGEHRLAKANAREKERQRLRAEESASKAREAANLEALERARAEKLAEENRVNLYAARITLVEEAFRQGNAARALQLLDSLSPQPGQTDLRSFDWYYLWQMGHGDRLGFPHGGRVLCTAFSPDGRLLATGGDEKTIRFWDVTNGSQRATLTGHTARVTALAFAPDGQRLASAGADATVRIWETVTGRELQVLRAGTNCITALAITPDGGTLAAGEGAVATGGGNPTMRYQPWSESGMVVLWNTESFEQKQSFSAHGNGVVSLAFSRDGHSLISGGGDHSVKLHDCTTGRMLAANTNFIGNVFGMALTPDGKELAVATWSPHNEDSGEIRILDAKTLEPRRVFSADAGKVLCLSISPDGSKLASAGADLMARLWEFPRGVRLATFNGHNNTIASLAFAPDSRNLATADWYGAVKLWSTEAGVVRQRISTRNSFSVAYSPDGELLVCGGRGVELRDAASGALLRTLDYTNGDVRVAFSPDGSILAAVGENHLAHFWDRQTWQHWPASPLSAPTHSIEYVNSDLAFSPDSRTLVIPADDGIIRFLDTKTGQLTGQITASPRPAFSVAFTPDGQELVAGYPQSIGFWDAKTKRLIRSISQNATLLRLSPDGRWIASGSQISPTALHRFPALTLHASLSSHKEWIWGIAFSHDSRLLATASWDSTVKLWHVASGQELLTIPSQSGVVWSVAFSPDDRALAFGSGANSQGSGIVTILRAAHDESVRKRHGPARLPIPSREELARRIAPRAADCPANLIDLGPWFNASLTNSSLNPRFGRHDLSGLPTGIQKLGVVSFDVRGIVQVSCAANELTYDYPVKVEGIRVAQRCRALHFLQSAAWLDTWGTLVGQYVIHYAEGRTEKVPLIYGNNLLNWLFRSDAPAAIGDNTMAVWSGVTPALKAGAEIRVFDFCWRNPPPARLITSIDFESAMSVTGPFLLAITAE
jgi:eukaryotic-like serine/threonine-protein kinase